MADKPLNVHLVAADSRSIRVFLLNYYHSRQFICAKK
jgi:hypothetical protein